MLPPVLVPKNNSGEIPTSFPELPSLDELGMGQPMAFVVKSDSEKRSLRNLIFLIPNILAL